MIGKLDNYFRANTDALKVRTFRQELLASNIANADTPNYKAVDVDFGKALKDASEGRQGKMALAQTNGQHLPAAVQNPLNMRTLYRNEKQSAIDGNTVDVDTEMAHFTDNAMHYQANLTFINQKIKSLLSALQSR